MAKRYLLDFEKPLVELEKQIEQIKELARDSEVDVSQQLLQLETLAARRREEIFKSLTPAQKIQVASILKDQVLWTLFKCFVMTGSNYMETEMVAMIWH